MRWPLAVSSLGMPEGTLSTFLDLALSHGCTGVELRAAPDQPLHTGLDAVARAGVAQALRDRGLVALDVSSYVRVCAPGDDAHVVEDLSAHLRLAADVGSRAVRVFPGGVGDGDDDARGVARIAAVLDLARALGVDVQVETHDSHGSGAAVADLLRPLTERGGGGGGADTAGPPAGLGVVWDVLHTWRTGERPADTVAALGGLLQLVQVKDAAGPGPNDPLTLPGEGALPVAEVLAQLDRAGYAGWLSLEWERPWSPDLPDLDTALAAARPWLEAAEPRTE